MKKIIFSVLFFSLVLTGPVFAKFPIHLGGFSIGNDITLYPEKIDQTSCQASLANPYIGEGKIKPGPGFKSGFISYGLCDSPNQILRIKLKFIDPSKKFYNTLLKRYKKALGEPSEYKGDSFQTMIAWKWSFSNDQGQTLSLILQHNIAVEDEKMGNAVKLTLTDQLQKERDCYLKSVPETRKLPDKNLTISKDMWDSFIPY